MSVLKYLFKDKNAATAPEPEEQTPMTPPASEPTGEAASGQDAAGVDFDEIRNALDQIAGVLGRGEGYDMLKTSTGNVTAVDLKLSDLMTVAPDVFDTTTPSPADEDRKVTVLLEDIFSQLGTGKIEAVVANLVADVPSDYLVADLESRKSEKVLIPLPLVVGSISPEELRKRTTNVERDTGIEDLPNIFSPSEAPAVSAEEEREVERVLDEVVATPVEPVTEVAEEPEVSEPEPVQAVPEVAETVTAMDPAPVVEDVVEPPEVEPEPAAVSTPEVEDVVADVPTEPVAEETIQTPEAELEPAAVSTPEVEDVVADVSTEPVAEEPVVEEVVSPPAAEEGVHVADDPADLEPETVEASEPVESVEPTPVEVAASPEPEPALAVMASPAEPEPPQKTAAAAAAEEHALMLRGLDLNSAGSADLVLRLDGVGPKLAYRIVAEREVNGPFLDILDLARVPGLGRKTFTKITGMRWPEGEEALPGVRKQILHYTDDGFLNVRAVAEKFGELPGFAGCILAHRDGYVLAASWDNKSKDALGAFAPQIFKKVASYVKRLDMGSMDSMTVVLDQRPITFVPSEDVFFVAIHEEGCFTRKHVRLAYGVGCRLGRLLKRRRLAA